MKNIIVLEVSKLTSGQARYWLSDKFLSKMDGKGVTMVDPFRRDIRLIKACFKDVRLYRASTGGKWGKSSEIVQF